MVTTNISGCKYHDPLSVMNFDLNIQFVGVTSSIFDNILIMQMIRGKR